MTVQSLAQYAEIENAALRSNLRGTKIKPRQIDEVLDEAFDAVLLSELDRRIMRLAADGMSKANIARLIGKSPSFMTDWAKKFPQVKFSRGHVQNSKGAGNRRIVNVHGIYACEVRDFTTLIRDGNYPVKDAVKIIKAQRNPTKVRGAPKNWPPHAVAAE